MKEQPPTAVNSASCPTEPVGVAEVCALLLEPTPQAWLDAARSQVPTLLIDHANCEKKAAGTALSLLYRYVDRPELLDKLAQLAREELLHFEQVVAHLHRLNIDYVHITPSAYAGRLRKLVASHEPWRLVDTLIVGAVVEARSCERFYRLTQVLDAELAQFYRRLLASEARHYADYLALAKRYAPGPIEERLRRVLELDAELIVAPDKELRFHSGPPGSLAEGRR